jgi:hypothetical protein
MGFVEFLNEGILWANHIPSFLQVQDESVQRTLQGFERDSRYRVVTVFTVSLVYAEYLVLITPFVLDRALNGRSIWACLAWGIADLIVLLAIVLTQSRLGVVGWIVVHAVQIFLWALRLRRSRETEIVGMTVTLFYPVAVLAFVVSMFTVDAVKYRTISGGSTTLSDDSRREQFSELWPKLLSNPFGHGPGQAAEVLGYKTPMGYLTVDSYVITMLLDFGILGFLLFFGIIIYLVWDMVKLSIIRATNYSLSVPLAALFAAELFVKLVLSQPDLIPLLSIFIAMAAALNHQRRSCGSLANDTGSPRSAS